MTELAGRGLHLVIILALLLSFLPAQMGAAEQWQENQPELSESQPALYQPPALESAVPPSLAEAEEDPRPVYDLEQLAALQGAAATEAELAAEKEALLASFDLPELGKAAGPTLSLAGKGALRPGEPAVLAYQVDGAAELEGLELRLSAPPGFTWSGETGRVDEKSGQVILEAPAGRDLLTWEVAANVQGPFEFQAVLLSKGLELARASLQMEEDGLSVLPAEGGLATGFGERVQISFPEGAADEALAVRVRRPLVGAHGMGPQPPHSLSGQPFEITAVGQSSRAEVRQFAQPLTITVRYEDWQAGENPHQLQVYYYNETSAEWAALPTRVDLKNQLLIATSEHLTVFDIHSGDWQEARLPSLHPYQVAPFTGAASFSVPLWTPPGPAGLAPSLALSYNSQAVDNISLNTTQAAWVGMGWSLEAGGAIERIERGFSGPSDDTYAITAGGVASEIVKGTDGQYHTLDESFWRIEYNQSSDVWTAWDRQGTQYTFESKAIYPYDFYTNCDDENPPGGQWAYYATWKWGLTKVRNIYGQELHYNYWTDTKNVRHPCQAPGQPPIYPVSLAVYLDEIEYPHGQYTVKFERAARGDYKLDWASDSSKRFFERYRLSHIAVKHQGQEVRRYTLNYNSSAVIFPNFTWNAGGSTLTLLSVVESAPGGGSLPATSFEYSDGLHITAVNNGYGGRVEYGYESTPWYETSANQKRTFPVPTWPPSQQGVCVPAAGENYYMSRLVGINGGTANCNEPGKEGTLFVTGQAVMGFPIEYVQPGGAYRVTASVSRSNRYQLVNQVNLSVYTGTQALVADSASNVANVALNGVRSLPGSATNAWLHVYCSNKCIVGDADIYWLAARHRVEQKHLYDGINLAPHSFQYRYDEPATLDPLHSASFNAYRMSAYTEFRGHAQVSEIGPDGRVSTTFYNQDDLYKGRSSVSLVSSESFHDSFAAALNSAAWAGASGGVPSTARLRGEYALKLTGDSTWRAAQRQAAGLTDGKAVLGQFLASGSASEVVFGLESDAYRWGVYAKADGSLVVQTYNGAQWQEHALSPGITWQRDAWYNAVLVVDDDEGFQAWVWQRDNPGEIGRFSGTMAGGRSWRFSYKARNATAWLDGYSEGNLYSLSQTQYGLQTWTHIHSEVPTPIQWIYTAHESQYNFEGDGSWTGVRSSYSYGSYGSRTRALQAWWDAGAGAWRDYRISVTDYLNNITNTYLVGYPWVESVYRCAGGSLNAACLSAGLLNANLLSQSRYVYDNQLDQPPTLGKLTARRAMLRWAGANYTEPRYLDETYGYDSWGNITQTTVYNSEGSAAALASGDPRTSVAVYDSLYHTYLVSQSNPLGHTSSFTYNTNLGLPASLTGPNGAATTISVSYDLFGRPLKIIRPGDDANDPTIQFTYTNITVTVNGPQPFNIALSQKIDATQRARFVRYYNGLGQVVQSQTIGALLESGTANLVSDAWYDAYGQVIRQSTPYTTAYSAQSVLHTPAITQTATVTAYDLLGRPQSVTGPNGVAVSYAYRDLETRQSNGLGNTTRTLYDVWGRVTQVIPLNGDNDNSPAGPAIAYFYDDLDRLTTVWQGTQISTTLTYDFAGRKMQMNDPDMGVWYYTYDALGNLKVQRDAKNQRTCLYYDALNRLEGKHFRGDDNCPAPDPQNYTVWYRYDDTLNDNYGIGQRTGMSDASGVSSWRYDERGQLVEEVRQFNGGYGSFRTAWQYNAAGLLTGMWYPADNLGALGELVTYTYLPQMALDQAYVGSPPGNPIYVQGTSYDEAGRVTLRTLGNNAVQTRYSYYAWNIADQGGRLQRILSETPGQTIRQDFRYLYDKNGNITEIQDYVSGAPQRQQFEYDSLDRLKKARAYNGWRGNYDWAEYAYDPDTGNMSSKAGWVYTYGDPAHKHAVTALSTGNTYGYRCNGKSRG